jgi:hypothetical protein
MAAESDRSRSDRRVPRPPAGLFKPGRRFWRTIVREFDLSAGELLLLERACHVVDDLATLDSVLAAAPVEVVGGNGQPALHPGWAERRAHAALLARLVGQLGIPATDEDDSSQGRRPGPTPKPEHLRRRRNKVASLDDRRVARARWQGA